MSAGTMIDHLNNFLRHLLVDQINNLTDEAQIGFQPPDEIWRQHVSGLPHTALNIYLVDLRENQELRSNERVRSTLNGVVRETLAPRRMDCHYLISAWSPVTVTPAVEPTLDEHALLYEVTRVLMTNTPLNPSRLYPTGSAALKAVPEPIREADLPLQVLPAEGFPKLAEFWGAMGDGSRWKPALYLVVTLPIVLQPYTLGPMITTRIIEFRPIDQAEPIETWVQIGGQVVDATGDSLQPVANASVQIETPAGETVQTKWTDTAGRFIFGKLSSQRYRLRTQVTGLGEAVRDIELPPPLGEKGEYDLRFE
ncbi:MAG: DUF4255 domain-containing protein [Anaerolineae bacterium]|nr:DUF4255 domain-containing protein [Anaerolineae bacterium]